MRQPAKSGPTVRVLLGSGNASLSLLAIQARYIGEYKFRQIIAVTTFQHAEGGNLEVAERLAQPVVIFSFEGFIRQWIAGIGIEAGGDGNNVGFKTFQIIQCAGEYLAILGPRSAGGDGIIK